MILSRTWDHPKLSWPSVLLTVGEVREMGKVDGRILVEQPEALSNLFLY